MLMTMPCPDAPKSQAGISLLEVLIAVLVLSVGLLGIGAMQTTNVKNSQSALLRSAAVVLAAGMAERIRAHPASASAGHFRLDKTCVVPKTTVSVPEMELASWVRDIHQRLGNAATSCGQIDHDIASRTYSVKVIWDDSRALGGSKVMTVSHMVRY